MYTVSVKGAAIGQIITEPIIAPTGVLLCNPGTPISNTLKRSLINYGVREVPVNCVIGDKFDKESLNFKSLNNLTRLTMNRLKIEDVAACANILVENLRADKDSLLLQLLFKYDESTGIHSINVASLALTAGIRMQFGVRELYLLALGCLLHDIGKVNIPTGILNKPGKLTTDEFDLVKMHPKFGVEILDKNMSTVPAAVKQIILQHHENHDGSGYPRGLKDFHIYKLARLVHIADAYEALCSKRPYKGALPRDVVREYLIEEADDKFDPIMLRKFLEAIPMYLIGEEIECNGLTGVIIDIADGTNPLVSVGRDIVRLSDFQNVKYTKQKIYFDCNELIFR